MNAGKQATAHEARINFHGWIGEGYILVDLKTGAGAYMISGGGNGGELVNAGNSKAVTIIGFIALGILAVVAMSAILALIGYFVAVFGGAAIVSYALIVYTWTDLVLTVTRIINECQLMNSIALSVANTAATIIESMLKMKVYIELMLIFGKKITARDQVC
ncbi:MAG: hypothetical protein ACI4NJ_01185 [Cellvibrio sp.]